MSDFCYCILLKKHDFKSKPYISVGMLPLVHYPPMTKLTGLWKKVSAKNVTYYVGRLGLAKLVLLANKDKQMDTDPDVILFVQERDSKPQEPQEPRIWDGLTDDPGEPVRKRDSRSTGGF